MDVLLVCGAAPTFGHPRTHGFIAALARYGHTVTLVFADRAGTTFDDLSRYCRQVIPVRHRRNLAGVVADLIASERFDLAHLDIRAAMLLGRPLPVPTVVDAVTCFSRRLEHALRISAPLARVTRVARLARIRRQEFRRLAPFEHIILTAEDDLCALRALGIGETTDAHIYTVPSTLDLQRFAPPLNLREPATLLLDLRDLSRSEARHALRLAAATLAIIWRTRPEVRLTVLGASDRRLRSVLTADPRVTFVNPVRDARIYLTGATLALAPVAPTATTPHSALEAMATALPLAACERLALDVGGRDGEELLVAEGPFDLARATLVLLNEPPVRGRLGRAARRLVERRHSWELAAIALTDVYAAASGSSLAEWRLQVGLNRPLRAPQSD
ncbi:MAG: glycosyltransferase [Oscillochloridaceae bacterium]|nr:glycosyltransferase [Chloroflexaceae bacterium]MDW8388988.1 glycosyltransferase [Oscillochloridaceae bacterium]